MLDVSVIVVSTNEAHWLTRCLSTVHERRGDCAFEIVVVDNESSDGTRELVEREFPEARVVPSENHGFSHANNRALMTCDARYVLFLNPDTEIVEGTLGGLVRLMDERPDVGLAGVIQLTGDGETYPTIRRFPSVLRAIGQAVGSERFPVHPSWLGERELDLDLYGQERPIDWTSGSFMLVRREALDAAGFLDERFFIYSEETDLCLRIRQSGWEIRHLPQMTIIHHAGKGGTRPRMVAQEAYGRIQYARKHFPPIRRAAYAASLGLGYTIRAVAPGRDAEQTSLRRSAARSALRTMAGLDAPPFGRPPRHAVAARPRGAA